MVFSDVTGAHVEHTSWDIAHRAGSEWCVCRASEPVSGQTGWLLCVCPVGAEAPSAG